MKISVKVKTGAKKEKVEEISAGVFLVSVKEQPEKGKANQAVIKALAKHFKAPISEVKILSGRTSRLKIVKIG
ncbi:MAG TPA: DUF167 domain-containing protein [bacterium]|nr:DUF167 domain-containing protein [bacterium]